MYASDVNICPDNLPHEPKFSHLRKLHSIIADYADVIAYSPAQLNQYATPLNVALIHSRLLHREQHLLWFNNQTQKFQQGNQQFAYVYKMGRELAFVESDANVWVLTQYNGKNYDMPPYSVSLVDETGKELYNTAKVAAARVRIPLQSR